MVEINASNEFRDNLVLVVSKLVGEGYTKEIIHIEYEWEPPRCSTCLLHGHSNDDCPKATPKRVVNGMGKSKDINSGISKKPSNDGCTIVKQKGGKTKKFNAIQMNKFEYRPIAPKDTKTSPNKDNTKEASTSKQTKKAAKVANISTNVASTSKQPTKDRNMVSTFIAFAALDEIDDSTMKIFSQVVIPIRLLLIWMNVLPLM